MRFTLYIVMRFKFYEIHVILLLYIYEMNVMRFVKLWFTKMLFVGFYSVPNLIVIIFNLLYPVFIVGFDCKGCVIERECVKTQATEDWRGFRGYLAT